MTLRKLTAAVLVASLAFAVPASAQLGGLRGLGSRLGARNPITNLIQGKDPITTSLQDAKWADASKDGWRPREAKRSLLELQRTPNGGFVLQPGYYEIVNQSYCLKAGTHGPGGGDGYLFAPPEGSAEEAVMTIIRNSVHRPEIEQRNIQQLLWAIIARAKFEDLSTELKATAAQLLTPRQLASLNRNALDVLQGPLGNLVDVPSPLRKVLEAEQKLRQLLTMPGATFAEMERVAVLTGAVGIGPGSRDVPSGRWSNHPDGYSIRYIPSGYSTTQTEIWVPQGSPAVGKEYDPAAHIAVPGNTARQRLIQSARPVRSS